LSSLWLSSNYNKFAILCNRVIDIQEEVIVEVLLDSSMIYLIISLELTKKQGFKLKKIKRPIYVRNMNSFFNKEESIEHTVEVNIYYQGHRKRI